MDDTTWRKNAIVAVQMLGNLRLWVEDEQVALDRKHRVRPLLAYLAYPRLRVVRGCLPSHAVRHSATRIELIRVLWPQDSAGAETRDDKQDRMCLRQLLKDLRFILKLSKPGDLALLCENQDVCLNSNVVTDIDAVLPALSAARQAEPSQKTPELLGALRLFRGELLPGLDAPWIEEARSDFAALYAQVLEELAGLALQEGQASFISEVIQAARLCQFNLSPSLLPPARCDACITLLMRLHLRLHQPHEALAHYARLEQSLSDGMQLSAAAQEAFKEAHAMARAGMAARQGGPLIGRSEHIEQLKRTLLCHPPLVTLTGPPGVGKTSLAEAVLPALAEAFGTAIHSVDLQALTRPDHIASAILAAVGIERTSADAMDQLLACLASRPTLLLLDNLDHLLESGGTTLVERLLARLPLLTCLVTSRQRLDVATEIQFALPPLAVPGKRSDLETSLTYPSVQVFAFYARKALPTFAVTQQNAEAVGTLCRLLDGLPLALRLFASWAHAYSPQQMLERLTALSTQPPPRARRRSYTSLDAAIAWSYGLLPAHLKPLFACLSVFQGGWTLGAAQVVCGLSERQVVEALADLQARSLISARDDGQELRFSMLNTLHAFAAHVVCEERPQARHAAYFFAMAEEASGRLQGPDQGLWLERLEDEQPNLRAALDWYHEGGAPEDALRFTTSLRQFWLLRGHWKEGQQQLEQALAACPAPTPLRATALNGLANLVRSRGDYAYVRRVALECLAVSRAAGFLEGIPMALINMGLAARQRGEYALARWLYAYSLAIDRGVGDRRGEAVALTNLGALDWVEGSLAAARDCFERSLALCRSVGDWNAHMGVLNNLALVLRDQGNVRASRQAQQECLDIAMALGNRQFQSYCYNNLGMLDRTEGDLARSTLQFEQSLRLKRELGLRKGVAVSLDNLACNARLQGDWERGRACLRESLCIERDMNSVEGMVESITSCARLACCEERHAEAVALFATAGKQRDARGLAPTAEEEPQDRQMLSDLRAHLGEAAFAAAWKQGQERSLEMAVASCLGF